MYSDYTNIVFSRYAKFLKRYYTLKLLTAVFVFIFYSFASSFLLLIIQIALEPYYITKIILLGIYFSGLIVLFYKTIFFNTKDYFSNSKYIFLRKNANLVYKYYPQVKDVFVNFLDLYKIENKTEITQAAILQKAKWLSSFDFSKSLPYKPFYKKLMVLLGFLLTMTALFSYQRQAFKESYKNLVRFEDTKDLRFMAHYSVLNDSLTFVSGESFDLRVKADRNYISDNLKIEYGDKVSFLRKISENVFGYSFHYEAEDVAFQIFDDFNRSEEYLLKALKRPIIKHLSVELKYPPYTKQKNKEVFLTGYLEVPEGTKLLWKVKTEHADSVFFESQERRRAFKKNNIYSFSKTLFNDLDYHIYTANDSFKKGDFLSFKIDVVEDELPKMTIQTTEQHHYIEASDDYEIASLEIVYFQKNKQERKSYLFNSKPFSVAQVSYFFPDSLKGIEAGKNYTYYFQIKDNYPYSNNHIVKSKMFQSKVLVESEKRDKMLNFQKNNISSIEKLFDEIKKNPLTINPLEKRITKKSDAYSGSLNNEEFLNSQIQNQKLLEDFLKNIAENQPNYFEKENLLSNKIGDQLQKIKEHTRLLDSIKKLPNSAIDQKIVDRINKKSDIGQKEMEQLINLTKKFYVKERLKNIIEKLRSLAKEQKMLASLAPNKEQQEPLNLQFENIIKEIDSVEKTNRLLVKPIEIQRNKTIEIAISTHQNTAKVLLEQSNPSYEVSMAKASKQLSLLANYMSKQAMKAEQGELKISIRTLRKLIDYVLDFSFEQEEIYNAYANSPEAFEAVMKRQARLKPVFQQIEDSIYVLSMGMMEMGSEINNVVEEIYYQTDASTDYFQKKFYEEGLISSRKVFANANTLGSLLVDILTNLELESDNSNPSNENNKSGQQQLQDIINNQKKITNSFKKGKQKMNYSDQISDKTTTTEEILKLYKEQQKVKQQFEKLSKEQNVTEETAKRIKNEIDNISKKILTDAYANPIARFSNLMYQFQEVEKAIIEQGKSEKRESETFEGNIKNKPSPDSFFLNNSDHTKETLNRNPIEVEKYYKNLIIEYYRAIN